MNFIPIKSLRQVLVVLVALLLLVPIAAQGAPLNQDTTAVPVDSAVLAQFDANGTSDYWVVMKDQADLRAAPQISDWNARGQYVYDQLTSVANNSQKALDPIFKANPNAQHKRFWIVNAVRVKSDRAVLNQIIHQPGVKEVLPPSTFKIPDPIPGTSEPQVDGIEWNISAINAPQVWSTFGDTGQGIVIANIDTGVQFDHPALVNQYRGNTGGGTFNHDYNWFDPSNACPSPLEPCDNNGHGTHTMGIMVGSDGGANQIGVAPGARFIMAKGCETNSCSDYALISSAQWMLAPTKLNGTSPRPDLRPQIVNNSWGDTGGNFWYQSLVQAWIASGIFPAFSAGNSGQQGCGSAGSPGDYPESYASGAFDINNFIAYFSSLGPAVGTGLVKPNIAAPGMNVLSSYSFPSNSYALLSGTSMASPHTAAAVALIWSEAPGLMGVIPETREILDQTAIDTSDLSCGGTAANNNVWGEGRLDAFAAVSQSPVGSVGKLQGTVKEANTSLPIAGATVKVTGPITHQTTTDSNGFYTIPVLTVGDYSVTVTKQGYSNGTAMVTITQASTTTKDFALQLSQVSLSGFVRDEFSHPLANATVTILGAPVPAVKTNANGAYLFPSVPVGTYDVKAEFTRCNNSQTRHLVLDKNSTVFNFILQTRVDSFGYSCQVQPLTQDPIIGYTDLALSGDNASVKVDLPFSFSFYGMGYSSVWVCTNGYLSFSSGECANNNTAIPNIAVPNAAIYSFWDDLYVDSSATVRTQTLTAPSRFKVEWYNVSPSSNPAKRVDFEVVLYETGQILTQYRSISADSWERGNSATLGIENEAGTVGFQYSTNEAVLGTPEFAVLYKLYPKMLVNFLPLIYK